MSQDLLATARRLAKASPQKPRQSDLKRAISTAYYALFHAMARNAADMLVGAAVILVGTALTVGLLRMPRAPRGA